MERLRRYIEQNYDRRISLAVLAAEADLSSCYISRAFHRAFGMGPVSYTNRFRIGRARELLASGESVTRTAYRCGFDNPRYFSSVFRALTGLAPRAFARGTAEGAQNCRH